LAKRALKMAGSAVVPALTAALADPRFRRKTDTEHQNGLHLLLRRSQPIVTVLDCLVHLSPREAVPAVAPLVEDEDTEVRKETALLLGSLGSDSAASPLTRSLRDNDDYVRSYAMMGILRAIEADRVTDAFRAAAFEAVKPLVFRSDRTVGGEAPKCLLALDRDRAILFLTHQDRLVLGSEGLNDALRALREADVVVDERPLLQLVSALEGKVEAYPNDYVVGEALRLLAKIDSESARGAITCGTQSPSSRVREDATQALAATHGILEPFGVAFDRLDAVGWPGLTEAQRKVLAVRVLIDQVENGGFSQYFVNSYGAQWHNAEVGLDAIGAIEDLALFRQATAMFGSNGPSTDDDRRHRELARVVENNDDIFSPLEEQFYKDEQDREVLLLRYIIAHPSDFHHTTPRDDGMRPEEAH